MATPKEVVAVLMALGAACRAEVVKEEVTVWCNALRSIDAGLLAEATDQWIKESKFMPRPAELIQLTDVLARRRRDAVRALPGHELEPDEQKAVNRRGIALVRAQLRQGKLRVGKRVDDVLAEDEA